MQEFGKPLLLALGIHLGFIVLMVIGTWNWHTVQKPRLAGLNIEAVVVDANDLNRQIEQAQKQAETQKQREDAISRRKQQLEAQKLREEVQDDAANKRQQALAEQRRLADLEKQRKAVADRKRQAELDRKRKAQDELVKKQQAELDAIRKQREDQQRKIDEESAKLRQLAEDRKAREKAAADKRMRDQLNAEDAARVRAEVLGTVADEYLLVIQNKVTRNWIRPPTAKPGLRAIVKVTQIVGGDIVSVTVGQFNGDEATRRSIIAAVQRAEPLPYSGFEEVFDREIEFEFKYDGE